MRAIVWKITTFSALGVAAFLAFHPVGSSVTATGAAGAKAHAQGGGLLGNFFGGSSSSDTSAPRTGTHIQTLREARNTNEECEALRVLGAEATSDVEAVNEIVERTAATHPREVRACAINALRFVPTGSAKSYLGELIADSDTNIRDLALRALASKAKDDPDARSTLIAAAHSEDRSTRIEALIALGEAHIPEASALIQTAIIEETGDAQSRLVNALGDTRDPAAIPAIAKMITSGSSDTREAAIEALGTIGGDAALVVLKDTLQNGTRGDVTAAASALAATGDATAKQALIDATETGRHDQQLAALRALSHVDGADVRAAMVKGLHTSDPQLVRAATNWFAQHADRTAIPELASMLKSAPQQSHDSIVSALATIGGDDAREAIAQLARSSGPDQVSALNELNGMPGGHDDARKIALKVAKEGGQSSSAALGILGRDGTPESREALVSLARLGGENAQQAMSALSDRGDPDAMRALGDLARTARTPQLRGQALAALASTNDPKNSPMFVAAARDKDATVRRAAINGLGRIGGEGAERTLIDAMSDTDNGIRSSAIRWLGNMHTASSAAQLEKLTNDADHNIARNAYSALATNSPERAVVLADRAMSTGTPEARQMVLNSVEALPSAAGKRILLSALRDADADVATQAISSLANIGGAESQQALLDLLTADVPENVKRAAADALDRSGTEMVHQHSGLVDKYKTGTPPDGPGESDSEDDGSILD